MHTIDKVKIPQYCSMNKTLKEKAFPIAASEDTSTCFIRVAKNTTLNKHISCTFHQLTKQKLIFLCIYISSVEVH